MALKTISQLKDSVAAILSGLDLSNVDNLNGCLERAARTLVQKADVPEASGIQNITLYSGVTDYACNENIFGTAINDIRPQGISRNPSDYVLKVDQQDFDRTKNYYYPSGTMSTFQYQNGQPIIRIVAPFPPQAIRLDPMNSIGTSPNEWVAAGTASGLIKDSTDFYQSPASLRFQLGTGVGTLTKTLQNSNSMADYENVGVAFLAIEVPAGSDATDLTNISLKLGSDSGNYDSVTETEGFLGAWIAGQWLLVAFNFDGASSTGTPNWSSIQYVQVSLTAAASLSNFRVGGLFMSLPSPAQILYQSAAIYLPSGSSIALTTITDNTDSIILNNPAYTIYEYESALAVLQQTGGGAADSTVMRIDGILNGKGNDIGLYPMFRGDNPSQELRMVGEYYSNDLPYNSW